MSASKGNILILTSWSYREPLTASYLIPYVQIIRQTITSDRKIWIQTLEKKDLFPDKTNADIIHASLSAMGIHWLPLAYRPFGILALLNYFFQILRLIIFCRKNNIGTLHSFAPPAGMAALILHFFTKTKLVVDSWEPHAESMVETGTWKKGGLAFRILWWGEKQTARNADVLIAASVAMPEYGRERFGKIAAPIYHRPGCVDTTLFNPSRFERDKIRQELGLEDKIVCVCVSKLGGLYLTREVFELFAAGQEIFGEKFHALLLCANPSNEVERYAREAGYNAANYTLLHVEHSAVSYYLAAGDFAFNPQKPVPSKRYGTPVKDGEYWAMALPLLILPAISDDSEIIERERAGIILRDLSHTAMKEGMKEMKSLLEEGQQLKDRIRSLATKYRSYDIARKVYTSIYSHQ